MNVKDKATMYASGLINKQSGDINEPTPEAHKSAPGEKLRPRAEVIIYSPDGILSIDKKSYILMPGGGVASGEKPVESALREAMEEADAVCHNIEARGVASSLYDPEVFKYKDWDGETTHFFSALYGGKAEMHHKDKEGFKFMPFDTVKARLRELISDKKQLWAKNNNEARLRIVKEAQATLNKDGANPIKYAKEVPVSKTYVEEKPGKEVYTKPERALDVAATTGLGTGAGAGAGSLLSRAVHGKPEVPIRMAHPDKGQTKAISTAIIKKIKGFDAVTRGALLGGTLGLAYGAYRATRKDGKPLPDYVQVPGVIALAGAGRLGYLHRGKVSRALKGNSQTLDMHRGYDDTFDYFRSGEQWIKGKRFKEMDIDSVRLNDELMHQLRSRNPKLPKSTGKIVSPSKAGDTVDDVWDALQKSNSPYIKATGGDPEAKVYMKMGKKRLSVDINPDFTGKNIANKAAVSRFKTTGGIEYDVVRDMSVGGLEVTVPTNKDPKKYFENTNAIFEDIKKRMGKDYDFSHASVGPAVRGGKTKLFIADRKMAGGHIHMQFPIDDTIKYKMVDGKKVLNNEDEMREILARRSAFVSLPFDMVKKPMPYRSGLYARTKDAFNEPYGINIVSERTMRQKPSWTPDPGYINFEHRISPTYMGENASLNAKKVKLMQIVNSNPELAKSVDEAMNEIVEQTGNETQYLHLPEMREAMVNKYREILGKARIKDHDIESILDTYAKGGIMKTSEEKGKDKKIRVSPLLAAGIAAPLAGYAAYRRFRRLPKSLTATQRAAKEGITIVTEKGLSKKNRLINKIMVSPDVAYEKVRGADTVGNQVYRGVVYHKNWTNDTPALRGFSRASGDVTINPPSMHIVRGRLVDKSKLHELPGVGKYFQQTYKLDDLLTREGIDLKSFANMTDDQADDIIRKIESKYVGKGRGFMKPAEGEAMGKNTSNLYAPVEEIRKRRLTKPSGLFGALRHKNKPYLAEHGYGLEGIKKEPGKYIIQENINPEGALKEYRIHTYDGKVLDSVRRFGALEGKPEKFFKSKGEAAKFEASLKKMYESIPEFSDTSSKRPIALAFDAVRDASGNIKMIELNPNSGFLFPYHSTSSKPFDYYSTYTLYKHLTGRDSGFIAGLKGVAAAGAAGGAAAGASALYNKKHAEDGNEKGKDKPSRKPLRNNPLLYGLGVGAGAAAIAYAASRKPWKAGKFYEVRPSLWYGKPLKTGKTPSGIIHTSREALSKAKLGPDDVLYANHPMRLHMDEHSLSDATLGGARKINFQKGLFSLMDKEKVYNDLPTYSRHLPKTYQRLTDDEILKIRELVDGKGFNEGVDMFNRSMRAKHNLPDSAGFFIKEKGGYGSRGVFFNSGKPTGVRKSKDFTQYVYDELGRKNNTGSPAMKWKAYLRNPDNFIIQEAIPGGRELRVATHNGKIVGVADRHGLEGALSSRAGLTKEQYKKLSEYTREIEKSLSADIGGGDTYLGHDIIIPMGSGSSPRLIETNTQEGLYDMFPNILYRSAMKKDNATAAAGNALAIGAPVAALTAYMKSKSNKRRKRVGGG